MSGARAAPALEAIGVSHRFGELNVLARVDFGVRPGEAVGVVGPNGAGKTTLLNVLSGALRPDSGHVRLGGVDVTRLTVDRRCRMGVGRAHQVPRPFGGMTVFENVLVGATHGHGLRPRPAHRCAFDALDRCRLEPLANRRADTLGLLDRKRLELARSLATGPSVLLLDEIGGGLTDAEALELLDIIADVRRLGISIVWIEHIVHVLVRAVDRLVCFDQGRVLADGEPQAVMADPAVIDAFLGSAELWSALSVEAVDAGYGRLPAVRAVSCKVREGETVALVGANGAGKSTLLRTIAGAHRPSGGRIVFDGHDVTGTPAHRRVAMGLALVPEGRRLFPDLTLEENLLVGRVQGRSGPWDVGAVMDAFPMLARLRNHKARTLSGGEQQATAISRALMANPRVLLIDEVSLGLSPLAVDAVYASLRGLVARGTALLLVEQNLRRALGFADRVLCLLEGAVVLEGGSAELTREQITAAYFGLRSSST